MIPSPSKVPSFSHNVIQRMFTFQNYMHIPNFDRRVSNNVPRQRNNPNHAETRRNVGGDSSRRLQLPSPPTGYDKERCLITVDGRSIFDCRSGIGGGDRIGYLIINSSPYVTSNRDSSFVVMSSDDPYQKHNLTNVSKYMT